VSDDNTVRLWDADSGNQIALFTAHNAGQGAAAFSPDGKLVAMTDDNTVVVCDANTGKELSVLGSALLWNAASGELIRRFEGHLGQLYDATFSPDGKRIVTAGTDNTARIWDAATGTTISVLRVIQTPCSAPPSVPTVDALRRDPAIRRRAFGMQ
jgi:WD40 repeat protein